MKKAAAVIICLITILGWFFSIFGAGDFTGIADKLSLGLDMIGGVSVVLEANTDASGSELKALMDQVQAVMEKRVNEMGLAEPVIAIENENRIRIDLPGAKDAQQAIQTIGKTAKLEFMTTDGKVALDGGHVKNATASVYQGYESSLMGTYCVNLEFDSEGAALFADATSRIVNAQIVSSMPSYSPYQLLVVLDNDVISDPYVNQVINSTTCQITGRFSSSDASNLAALIRGGSLPVDLEEVQTDIVGPSLGLDAAKTSAIAGMIGILIIFAIMIIDYRIMGVVADIALALYVLIIMWIYALSHAVLTLPGIAGLILSVGMAVDSNVIIFERIKEEIALGKTVRVAVQSGFKRAISTITDSQVTTIIAALILYLLGTGSVRGFALTLMIGIVVSILTAVCISQSLLKIAADIKPLAKPAFYGVKNTAVLGSEEVITYKYQFLDRRKLFYIAAGILIAAGIGIGVIRGYNLGIDFTGGTSIMLNNGYQVNIDDAAPVFEKYGIDDAGIVFAGENNEKIIIKTTKVLDNDTRSALTADLKNAFAVQVDEYVEQAGLIGPSVGTQLKSNAIKSCVFAGLAMLIYVAVRFEWRFGVASIMALCHDALMLFALYGLLHIQMNSPFIAGLLIIIGYSINDTIVIFDRIRENQKLHKKLRAEKIIDLSINQSITRSLMTSLTTLFSILPLIIMCGDTIREFAVPLIAGVVFGTVSSLFIASGLYYDICNLTKKNKYKGA